LGYKVIIQGIGVFLAFKIRKVKVLSPHTTTLMPASSKVKARELALN